MAEAQGIPAKFGDAVLRLDGDVDLLRDMAMITSEDLPEVKQKTEASIEAGDAKEAASGLHKLKGMLSTFEADGVVLEIQDLLDAARKGAMEEVQEGYRNNREAISELIAEIRALADGE